MPESTSQHKVPPQHGVSAAVVRAVADREGVDPTDLNPQLYDAIDPDALDTLLSATSTDARSSVTVVFEYAGYDIVVGSDGTLAVN
ncbi:HalOD1 output domain-containing protein [Haloferax profundi]|uniref:Halobacterial output domain-containing protein n=1 Tax=Haloferax profundi TaxID=1544718 RepID=A0A0W1R4T2_9EURY|nr:HalOD1 output domain-containing protein [Haloferax profundi]KTG08231.1 hypothetical protein AUR66_04210 [Haloferax profundi]